MLELLLMSLLVVFSEILKVEKEEDILDDFEMVLKNMPKSFPTKFSLAYDNCGDCLDIDHSGKIFRIIYQLYYYASRPRLYTDFDNLEEKLKTIYNKTGLYNSSTGTKNIILLEVKKLLEDNSFKV